MGDGKRSKERGSTSSNETEEQLMATAEDVELIKKGEHVISLLMRYLANKDNPAAKIAIIPLLIELRKHYGARGLAELEQAYDRKKKQI